MSNQRLLMKNSVPEILYLRARPAHIHHGLGRAEVWKGRPRLRRPNCIMKPLPSECYPEAQ